MLYSVLYPYSQISESITENQIPFFSSQWLQIPYDTRKARIATAFPDLNQDQIDGVARYHTFDHDISNINEYSFASIQSMTQPPFGTTIASKVKAFLHKLNDENYNLSQSDFFGGFFSRAINQLVAEDKMDFTPLPDPAHLNMSFIEKREAEAEVTVSYEAGTIRLEPEAKERMIRLLNLHETASVAEIGEALLQRMMTEESEN